MNRIEKEVSPRFEDFIFDWDHKTYLNFGGYGSGKSYHIALKICLKLLQEKRKALVVREVYETIRESCFSLFKEILEDMGLIAETAFEKNKVRARSSPMVIDFPNGSRIIFRGLDKIEKLKSINDVSIIWIEEASEIKYAATRSCLDVPGTRVCQSTFSYHGIRWMNRTGLSDISLLIEKMKMYDVIPKRSIKIAR